MTSISQEHVLLTEGAAWLGVHLSDAMVAQLILYLKELLRWSSRIDLVSQTDASDIIRKHFLDSLAVGPLLSERMTLLDLGSGAGFPGLPIAIALPHVAVSLVEIRRKRVSFLKEVVRKIKATNVTVYEGRVEALAEKPSLQGAFAAVITRATWNIATYLSYASPFLEDSGIVIVMGGPQVCEENLWPVTPRKGLFLQLQKSYSYTLPFGPEKRQLFIFTQPRFT
jgi:16S rRNA (guanine527-N7)-methyltransferase